MHNTWTELDLGTLRRNVHLLQQALKGGADVIFVVKANAYGHGLEPVTRCAYEAGIRRFAVAHVPEAAVLRRILPKAAVLITGVVAEREVAEALRLGVTPLVVSVAHAQSLGRAADTAGACLPCHAKVDTGMGRIGIPWETASRDIGQIAEIPGLRVDGICSHFASSDAPDASFTEEQAHRFDRVLRECRDAGLAIPFRHMSNSGAVLSQPASDLDAVRPGILLYGYGAPQDGKRPIATQPFLHWKTRIVQVRDVPAGTRVSYDSTYETTGPARLAVIDAGYADGIFRVLSNRGHVLVGGKRCPIVGRVTMNLTVIDLGTDGKASPGDEVVLIGTQGAASIWADEVARWADTIAYEVLTSVRTPGAPLALDKPGRSRGLND